MEHIESDQNRGKKKRAPNVERERLTKRQTAWTPNVERERERERESQTCIFFFFFFLGLKIGLDGNKCG